MRLILGAAPATALGSWGLPVPHCRGLHPGRRSAAPRMCGACTCSRSGSTDFPHCGPYPRKFTGRWATLAPPLPRQGWGGDTGHRMPGRGCLVLARLRARGGGGGRPVGMRSEEGAGGLGAVLSARGPSWREKLSGAETHFRRESTRNESAAPPAPALSESGVGKPREEKRTALSKVVLRRLPPGLTKEQLEEQLRPLPAHDYFEVVAADLSLYPHLYSRAYINFRNPDDILLFRDRFDGYIFIGNKGLEYPAVVEFAPFQKIAKKKVKKKDAKTGSIEDDPEYKQFLESYSLEEEKTSASPETLLGEIEAKTRELLARRTTPLLEYIKNRKLEKQRLREEKREERRRRELEKKRLREEEKRKRREEDRCKRKDAEKQKRAEKDVRIKLLKKLETGEEATTEKHKERGEAVGAGEEKQEARLVESQPETPGERLQDGSDKEPRDKRFREKEPETPRCHDSCRKHSTHSEFARFSRRSEEEPKWRKGFTQDGGERGQDGGVPADGRAKQQGAQGV